MKYTLLTDSISLSRDTNNQEYNNCNEAHDKEQHDLLNAVIVANSDGVIRSLCQFIVVGINYQ